MKTIDRRTHTILALLAVLTVWSGVGNAQSSKRDVHYGPGPLQTLDLTVPAGKAFPTVIFVHGGSLSTGDKADTDYRNVCAPFSAAGIACVSVNYRLAPEARWPSQAEDVAAAVAWVRSHIGETGGDPQKLFLLGHSSGAMLVAVVGTDSSYLRPHGMKPGDLRGVMPMGSIMWDEELRQTLEEHSRKDVEAAFARDPDYRIFDNLDTYMEHWPIRHVRAGQPPFLFLIAEGEQEEPPVLKTNVKFVEDARALGNAADHRVLAGRTHMSAIRRLGEPNDPVFAIVKEFVAGSGGGVRK